MNNFADYFGDMVALCRIIVYGTPYKPVRPYQLRASEVFRLALARLMEARS